VPGTILTEPYVPATFPPMRRPRREQFDPARHPWLHCTSRCVRKAFLCGGKDGRFDHRRQWVEDRLRLLSGAFAVEVASYAVMSNHFHVVLRMLPGTVGAWSASEVVRRWWTAYPPSSLPDGTPVLPPEAVIQAWAQDAAWVAIRRTRLGELQWFMKTLKEGISRRANREDEVTGTFWQARFHSVVLLDQAALVACMAYVDLNPIRAKMADRPERSAHTSVRRLPDSGGSHWSLAARGQARRDSGRVGADPRASGPARRGLDRHHGRLAPVPWRRGGPPRRPGAGRGGAGAGAGAAYVCAVCARAG